MRSCKTDVQRPCPACPCISLTISAQAGLLPVPHGHPIAQVEATSRKEKAKQRPLALNTVEMLRVASSSLGTWQGLLGATSPTTAQGFQCLGSCCQD